MNTFPSTATYIWFCQIHICDGTWDPGGNLGFRVLFQAVIEGWCVLLSCLPVLPAGRAEVVGVDAVLCERPAAGVLDGSPGRATVSRIAPALVVDVGGRGSAGEGGQVHALARGGVLLSREGGGLAHVGPPARPVRYVQIGGCHGRAHRACWAVC